MLVLGIIILNLRVNDFLKSKIDYFCKRNLTKLHEFN